MKRKVLKGAVLLARDPEAVWSYVRDMSHYPEWFPGIVEMKPVDELAVGTVGKRYGETAVLPLGREESIAVEVVVSDDAARHLAIHASLRPVLPRFDYRVLDVGNGSARFEWTCAGRAGGSHAALGRLVMSLVLRPRLAVGLANLKRIVEADPARTMRSARLYRFGPPAAATVLFDAEARPVPGKGEVLVRQRASSINQIDCHRRQGYGRVAMRARGALNFPVVLGNDIAGHVAAVGPGVDAFRVGDAVFGVKVPSSAGAFAEFVAVKADQLIVKPSAIGFEAAAALPYTFLTAWSALVTDGGLTPRNAQSKRVFVQGGAGGVGSMAVQIAKAWGAHVAASGSPDQIEILRTLGVDVVIDYTRETLTRRLANYDVAVCAASDAEQDALIAILKPDGDARYVTVIHPTLALIDQRGLLKGVLAAKRTLKAMNRRLAPAGKRAAWTLFKPTRDGLLALKSLVEAGKLRPIIDSVHPFARIVEAQEQVESGRANGKVVVSIADEDHARKRRAV